MFTRKVTEEGISLSKKREEKKLRNCGIFSLKLNFFYQQKIKVRSYDMIVI